MSEFFFLNFFAVLGCEFDLKYGCFLCVYGSVRKVFPGSVLYFLHMSFFSACVWQFPVFVGELFLGYIL